MTAPVFTLPPDLPIAFSMPGGPEWVFIFIIVLLLFGAKKLPELARGIGQSIGEFKKARQMIDEEIRKAEEETREGKGGTAALRAPRGAEPRSGGGDAGTGGTAGA